MLDRLTLAEAELTDALREVRDKYRHETEMHKESITAFRTANRGLSEKLQEVEQQHGKLFEEYKALEKEHKNQLNVQRARQETMRNQLEDELSRQREKNAELRNRIAQLRRQNEDILKQYQTTEDRPPEWETCGLYVESQEAGTVK